jgi:excisionase family DNA binding protein
VKTEGNNNLFDGFVQLIREAVREELEKALNNQTAKPPKLLMTAAEAAEMLSTPKTWIEARAREGRLRSVKCGHYRLFAVEDLKGFIEKAKTDKTDE